MRRLAIVLAALSCCVQPVLAYTPGTGTLFKTGFEGSLDADWEQGDGVNTASPWTQTADGGDTSFLADGKGPYAFSPRLTWARHFVHPVTATTFSIALEYRSEFGTGYYFDLELSQRAPALKKYRLRVDAGGKLSLWRSESGLMVKKAETASSVIPASSKRWLRFALESGATGNYLRVRVWSSSATAEPTSGWTLEYLDDQSVIARVHRFELASDGPKGNRTWIDDLDAWGDGGPGTVSTVTKIYLVEWSHLDIGFTEPPDTVEAFEKTSLDQVLANLASDPNYKWTIETAWQLDRWWERSTAAERQNMVNWLKTPRLRLAAGYASLHTTTAGHEELTRNLYWSSRFAREHQVPVETWITDDVPGSSFALPELLSRAGLKYFVGGMNTPFGGRTTLPNHGTRPFWWVGPDGSKVLSWITFDAYAEAFDYGFSFFDTLSDLYYKSGKKLPEQEEAGYPYAELMLMRAFDNFYGGFFVRDLVNQWNATYQTPRFVLATPEEFLADMTAKYGAGSFPSFSGDSGAAWSSSHANAQHTETLVRDAHRTGRAAEALLAMGAVVDGSPVPQSDLDFMYRKELEVDEHSGAGGWPGYFTPEEMDRNNRIHLGYAQDAQATATSLFEQGLARFTAQVPAAGDAVIVTNPLGRARDGWVRTVLSAALYGSTFHVVDRRSGAEVPFQRFDATSEILFRALDVPAVGYAVYDLVPGAPTATPTGTLSVTANTLENDYYRLVVNTIDGSLSSLYDKTRGREMIDPASSYHFNQLASSIKSTLNQPPAADTSGTATVTIDVNGPLMVALHVARTTNALAETTYRLYRGEDRVEFENVLDKTRTPYVSAAVDGRYYTVTLPLNVHNFNIRSETTTRFLDPIGDSFPRTDVFDWHNVEHTLAFWDGTGGAMHACDAVDSQSFEMLGAITTQGGYRHTNALVLPRLLDRSDEYQFADGSTGAYQIEPGTSPIFRFVHHVRTTGPTWDPVAASRFGFEALEPLHPVVATARAGGLAPNAASFIAVDAPNVLLYTVKTADDLNGIVLRMTELSGVATTARVHSDVLQFASPLHVEQDEDGGVPLVLDGNGDIVVPLGPYETSTIRVAAMLPAAAINLAVTKNGAGGAIRLQWSGGRAPYTLERAEDPQFTVGRTTLVDHQNVTTYDDPVLSDGKTYFYRVQ